ncbi:MAG: methyltransferase, partial [Firmicutes bacterium]|nr:methyltransferase [Bacillota bacterium]
MEKITQTLCTAMNSDSFVRVIFADRRKKSTEYRKVTLRPVSIKGEYMYQAEYHYDKKVTHRNISYFEGISFAEKLIEEDFKQINILTEDEDIQILASKPDKPRITRSRASHKKQSLDHDRKKQHLLQEGQPADFLVELGVMSEDGHVRKQHYGKFRQINRFLEIADNCFSDLPSRGTLRVIDFGCGKSYLTFALYYYLKKIQNRDVEI